MLLNSIVAWVHVPHDHTFFIIDADVTLKDDEIFVDEYKGFVEVCAVMTTSCDVCPELNGDITLSIIPDSAKGYSWLQYMK